MRIANLSDLKRYRSAGSGDHESGMSPHVVRQIEAALKESDDSKGLNSDAFASKRGTPAKPQQVSGESQGEASVRIALVSAFGDWHKGGEVVQELLPFMTRKYRADFALPRIRCYLEIDGWQHHGKYKSAHHADRERSRFFARHNWIGFRVSHKQALTETPDLIDAISDLMQHRQPVPRDSIRLEPREHKHGVWWQLIS